MNLRLPTVPTVQSELLEQGFVRVPSLLEREFVAELADRAMKLIRRHGATIDRTDAGDRLWYGVVTGDRICVEEPLLNDLYFSPQLVEWIRWLTQSAAVSPSEHLRSAININCLCTVGQKYPWHRDAVPYTALLFLTDLEPGAGGEFLIESAGGEALAIRPTAGDLVVMDGTRCPHGVAPLTKKTLRVTVPMVYSNGRIDRPAGLDNYLYESSAPIFPSGAVD
jgi:hypothetical protein